MQEWMRQRSTNSEYRLLLRSVGCRRSRTEPRESWKMRSSDYSSSRLQLENQMLDEEMKLKEDVENGKSEALALSEADVSQNTIVQNNENDGAGSGVTEGKVKRNSIPLEETVAVLTNGEVALEEDVSHTLSTTTGPVEAPMEIQDFSEGEPADVQIVSEDEDGTLVNRAERVIIEEEVASVPESHEARANEQEVTLLNPGGKDGAEGVEETQAAPEAWTQSEKSEEACVSAEPHAATVGVEMSNQKANQNVDKKPEGGNDDPEAAASVQSPVSALEGTTVASVPVYSEMQLLSLFPRPDVEDEVMAAPKEAKAAQDPATQLSHFQEVSLTDPQENRRIEEGEQEPLLSQVKAPQTQTEPAAAHSPSSTETQTTTRVNPGVDAESPKRKTCQCCSVM
ncbi:paralemmin-3 isoform X2 [Thalassophryne amazonica]|uniref:paralemmin-3 isoform X2 n=1 Tax=Thalassophryne amazonica TaxID=390379 RepID=UPI001470F1DB|nr:paralemmin-3 isoform X2 [Thalassophryne amazonica]